MWHFLLTEEMVSLQIKINAKSDKFGKFALVIKIFKNLITEDCFMIEK